MIDMEFMMQYSHLRSSFFDMLDNAYLSKGEIPIDYIIALFMGHTVENGVSPYIAEYFVKEWSKKHPEAFDDSNC